MPELTREDVAEVIRETVPALVRAEVTEAEDRITGSVIAVEDRITKSVTEVEDRITVSTLNSFTRVEADLSEVKLRLGRVEEKLDDMVTPAQHRTLVKRVEALEDKDR